MTRPITQAVVLAGGLGTRLGGLTRDVPKPLLPVAGVPFVDYIIRWLAMHGIEDIILSTGYLAPAFDAFLDGRTWKSPYGTPVRVRNAVEPVMAGTGGALQFLAADLDERFLFINGDSFFNCDLAKVLACGSALPPGEMLLTVRHVSDAGRYGRITLNGSRVEKFAEKSGSEPGLINAGISVLDRSVLTMIGPLPFSIETGIYPVLVSQGRLQGIVETGYFIDIGLPETYEQAQTQLPAAFRRPALFLDRDGVLNEDKGYVHRIEDFAWMPGAIEAIQKARQAGFLVVVVTNQAGVARGYYDEAAVERLHRHINAVLRQHDAWIDAFYYCPFHPDGTVPQYTGTHDDRKPGAGMLRRAALDLPIDMSRSFLVGDQDSDVAAATAAGIPSYKMTGENLEQAVEALLPKRT